MIGRRIGPPARSSSSRQTTSTTGPADLRYVYPSHSAGHARLDQSQYPTHRRPPGQHPLTGHIDARHIPPVSGHSCALGSKAVIRHLQSRRDRHRWLALSVARIKICETSNPSRLTASVAAVSRANRTKPFLYFYGRQSRFGVRPVLSHPRLTPRPRSRLKKASRGELVRGEVQCSRSLSGGPDTASRQFGHRPAGHQQKVVECSVQLILNRRIAAQNFSLIQAFIRRRVEDVLIRDP